jgi:hypothetical protein
MISYPRHHGYTTLRHGMHGAMWHADNVTLPHGDIQSNLLAHWASERHAEGSDCDFFQSWSILC